MACKQYELLTVCRLFQAHEQKMFGPKYVWVVPGDYPDEWWKIQDTNISCSSEQLMEALHGYIGTDVMPLSKNTQKTISGLVSIVLVVMG